MRSAGNRESLQALANSFIEAKLTKLETQSESSSPGGWLSYCAYARDLERQKPRPHPNTARDGETEIEGRQLATHG